jgi:hypothetical protein
MCIDRSTYNNLDMIAFGLPLVASALQLNAIAYGSKTGNPGESDAVATGSNIGHTRFMSASVLVVFLHLVSKTE